MADVKSNIPFAKNNKTIKPIEVAADIHADFHWFSLFLKKDCKPIIAITGMHNSKITCIEETALNLSYNGTKSIKKSIVAKLKIKIEKQDWVSS